VNERWPSYWREVFAGYGFEFLDLLRPRLWADRRIGFWFRQNMLVFATEPARERLASLEPAAFPIDIVHPEQFMSRSAILAAPRTIKQASRDLVSAVRRRGRRTFGLAR
jgi:hypothetical protein